MRVAPYLYSFICAADGKVSAPLAMSLIVNGRKNYNVNMKCITFPIILEADSDGCFVSCPTLHGCYSQGDTFEEAVANIKGAIRLHIEDRLADGEEMPELSAVSLSTVEVAV
jgi:predicted RNase H-like HicB family nuclease